MTELLTVATLRAIDFTWTLHLNRGSEHDTTFTNERFGLGMVQTTKKPRYELVRKMLYAVGQDGNTIDLLERDAHIRAENAARFCDRYNYMRSSHG